MREDLKGKESERREEKERRDQRNQAKSLQIQQMQKLPEGNLVPPLLPRVRKTPLSAQSAWVG